MSDADRYRQIVPYKIFQMQKEKSTGIISELWELSRRPYVDDLDISGIRRVFTDPEKLYSQNFTHITNWGVSLEPVVTGTPYPRLAPHNGRCWCNNHEDNDFFDYFVRVVFHDGVINLARIVLSIVHYQPHLQDNKLAVWDDYYRYPSNIVVKCKFAAKEGVEPYFEVANKTLHMYRKDTYDNSYYFGNPYDLPGGIQADRGGMDQYTLVVKPVDGKTWLKHGVEYLDFFAEGEKNSPFDISRILVFGANSEICLAPKEAEETVKVWNTQQIGTSTTGGPSLCVDDSFLEDPSNFLSYNYGPRTTLPEHYQYLRRSHDNDFFTAVPISEILYEDISQPFTDNGECNLPMLPGRYVVKFDNFYDIYQINIEYSGALLDINGQTTIYISTYDQYRQLTKTYVNEHQSHETAPIVHQRSRGVVSKWFPGYPWHEAAKTCLKKKTLQISFEIVHPNGFIVNPVIHHILIRTRNTDLICDGYTDPLLPVIPDPELPHRNTDSVVLGDWATGTLYTWDEIKQVYTCSAFQSPAYGTNSVYPDFSDNTTYAILDDKYRKYYQETIVGNAMPMSYLFDGQLHLTDSYIGFGGFNKFTFSHPATISFVRVFTVGPMTATSWLTCKIEDFDGYISEEKEFQIQLHQNNILGPGEHPQFTGGYFRTLPWDPDTQSLFTNLKSISFTAKCRVAGFQLWGNYLKGIQEW